MYIHLYRNQPQGNAITGRLVIDGRWFCDTHERKGYQILPLCYHVAVTQSPKFKRLLPIVQNVPNRSGIRFHRGTRPEHSTGCILVVPDNKQKGTINNNTNKINLNNNNSNNLNQQHSAGEQHTPAARSDVSMSARCGLISHDGSNDRSAYVSPAEELLNNVVNVVVNPTPVGCRSAAEIERELTDLILKAQQDHEEIILEISDFRPGSSGLA